MQKLARYLLATTALAPLAAGPTFANPLGPTVVAGDAAVSGEGTAKLTVEQATDKAIIDWRSFNIGLGEITQFNQPTSQSVVLNRVTGGEGASQILGMLKANGQVFLINPDGILFGKDAVVDVGGLVATTHDIANSDFMAGSYRFVQPGTPEASIVNLGTITVEDGGLAALVAPGVRNAGTMRANLGRIGLASADGFTLDFYGDELIQLAVDDSTAGSVIDLATGETLRDLVSNSGLLSANGGAVQLTASAARAVVNSVINNTGNIEADTVGTRNGKIVLGAATTAGKPAGTPIQSVKVSGHLSAAGVEEGETGGKIQLTGELIELTVATIDAFGWSGGGKVLIGGDYMGGNGDPAVIAEHNIALEPTAIPTSAYVFADERTSINASALHDGDGGKVILWSDEATVTAAAIQARGGALGGDGGFIETSGKHLDVRKAADASAPSGQAGSWLLDPLSVTLQRSPNVNSVENFGTFQPTGANSIIDTAVIEAALDTGTWVTISTLGTIGSGEGDIFVKSDILTTAGGAFGLAALDLQSAGDIVFSSGVDIRSSAGDLWLYFQALDGTITGANVGVIDVKNGSLYMNAEKGIVFHSSADMPRQFVLAINQAGAPASQKVDFDISFDADVLRFYHQNGVAYVPQDGVRLVDSSDSAIYLDAQNLDWVFFDRAMTVASHKVVGVAVDPGFNYGADKSAFLNGVPEIIWDPPGDFPIAADPTSPNVIPVIEVSEDGGSGVDRYVPTSETGKKLIAQFGLLTNVWNWIKGVTGIGEVEVSEEKRQQALELWRDLVEISEVTPVGDLEPKAPTPAAQTPSKASEIGEIILVADLGPTKTNRVGVDGLFLDLLDALKLHSQFELTDDTYNAGQGSSGGTSGEGFIYEEGTSYDLRGECVALVVALTDLSYPTKNWIRGDDASLGTLLPGAPVATFSGDTYDGQHTGVFVSYIRSDSGAIVGMYLIDQNNYRDPVTGTNYTKPAGLRYYKFGKTKYYATS